jgi:hypothetical protein
VPLSRGRDRDLLHRSASWTDLRRRYWPERHQTRPRRRCPTTCKGSLRACRTASPCSRSAPSLSVSSLSCSGADDDCASGASDCDDTAGDNDASAGDDDASAGDDDASIDPKGASDASQAGDYADELLKAAPYARLLIEVNVMEGADPAPDAFDTLVQRIEMLCNKPDGVTVMLPDDVIPADPAAGSNPQYTLAQIKALEATWRDHYTEGDQAVLYFLYVDGHSDYDTDEGKIVGYAYRGTSMAIFMGTVEGQPLLSQPTLQKTVTVHEFGHEIGLVDDGTAMVTPHKDPDHGPHCDNSSCMMYWTNNSSALSLLTGDVADFDDHCLADIAAAGGKDARGLSQPD